MPLVNTTRLMRERSLSVSGSIILDVRFCTLKAEVGLSFPKHLQGEASEVPSNTHPAPVGFRLEANLVGFRCDFVFRYVTHQVVSLRPELVGLGENFVELCP